MKLVVSDPNNGKTYQKELSKDQEKTLHGQKLSAVVKGEAFDLGGYELQITGGSDKQGFPMRNDLHGAARKKILLTSGTGYRVKRKGERRRKSVRGNTISEEIAQVNAKVTKVGSQALDSLLGKKEEKTEEKK